MLLPNATHPFADLERHFQTLVKFKTTNEGPLDVEAACRCIHDQGHQAAAQMLRRWHVPNGHVEADDIVQRWNAAMWEKGYSRCDKDKPVYPYAYNMLRYLCIAALKATMKSTSQVCDDQPTERAGWLEAMEHTERLVELERAIGQLPTNLRWSVEQWLISRRLGQRLTFPNKYARRSFHNLLFRARRLLKALLAEEPNGNGEFQDLLPAAEVQPLRRAISLRSEHPSLM